MILVDTSVWIDWLRVGDRPATRLLDRLIDEDSIAMAPVIEQELLMGARGATQLEELRAYFSALPVLMPTRRTFIEAGALYARCRWQGITPRSPHDCLIAQTALDQNVPLLADDRDFDLLATVEPKLVLLLPN